MLPRGPPRWAWISDRGAVAQIHDTAAEPALVQQLERGAHAAGQRGLASTDECGPDDELALVDKPGPERVRRDVRAAHGQVTRGRGLHVADRVGAEAALDPSLGGRHGLQGRGVDDLVPRLPGTR